MGIFYIPITHLIFTPSLYIMLSVTHISNELIPADDFDIPNFSEYGDHIFLSVNNCFIINQDVYNLKFRYPVTVVYNTTTNIVTETDRQESNKGNVSYHYFTQDKESLIVPYHLNIERHADNTITNILTETARQESNNGNVSYHYFTQGKEPFIVPYYWKTEKRTDNSYKVCSAENFSLNINTIPWKTLTHISDFDRNIFVKKRYLESYVEHLELIMCSKIFINASRLQELSFKEEWCTYSEGSNFDYYPRSNCWEFFHFHCNSGECIPKEWRFDGEIDCFDGSDEQTSEEHNINRVKEGHQCGSELIIGLDSICNDRFGCEDHTDEDDCFGDKLHTPQLKMLSLDYRTMMTTNFTSETENSINYLTIYKHSFHDIYKQIDFKRVVRKTFNFNNLISLNLSHNIFSAPSHFNISYISMRSVENLNLSHCEIETFGNIPLHVFPHLKILDLSHNKLKEIPPFSFFEMKKLIYLNLSMSLQQTDISLQFDSIHKMKLVDFLNNKLEDVSLFFTYGVVEIDLSTNPLKYNTINLKSDMSANIDKLNLHGNKIDINMLLIEKLKNVKSIDIEDYTLDCSDCRILQSAVFSERYSGISVIFNGTNHTPVCTLPEKYKGESVHKVNINEFCPNPLLKTVIAVSSVIGLAIVVCIIVAYKFRFEIMYYIQYMKRKRKQVDLSNSDVDGYEYDAFISYCAANREWVWDVLHPGLEDCPQKFRLCLHDRDFKLGKHIFENIDHSFQKSKFCVMIISNHFIKSHWCRFELDVASMKLIQENREFLILVQLEKLDSTNIPIHLANLLSTRTYLEWETDKFTENMLLERLRRALGKSIFERNLERTENTLINHEY